MKEIHAYRNEDGTYRLECIADTKIDGELREVQVVYARARLNIDALPDHSPGTICELIVDDN